MFESLPTAGYVRLPVVLKVYPVSKSTWWAGIKSGKYPAGIKLSERVTAWKVEDNRLLQGLKIKEEDQLLNGDGKLGNLAGLLKPGNFTAFNNDLRQKDDTKIDVIRRAILQLQLAERDPTGVVLNPADWADIELQKDSTGQYIWVDVTTGGESKVWRLAVVPTNAIAAGNFLVGDFPAAAVVYDRQEATIEISREHGDNFVKNMVTILVEERLGLAVEAPGALVYGPFIKP